MRLKGRQLRFIVGTLALWIGLRVAVLWPGPGGPPPSVAAAGGGAGDLATLAWPRAVPPPPFRPTPPPPVATLRRGAGPGGAEAAPVGRAPVALPAVPEQVAALAPGRPPPTSAPARPAPTEIAPVPGERLASAGTGAARSRWSGTAYLLVRPGGGAASLAAGGELGGSQAAARVAFQLNRDGPVRTAAAARLYAPIGAKGAEAALGLDWHPLPAVPLRLSVERRFDLDGHGRNAWSAYAAGGFYREAAGGRVALDGYAQAGVVGTERRDLFVDGALRAGRRWRLDGASVTAGAGLWGAAQPGVARLDVGPRVGAVLPVAGHLASLSVEGRFRVAGGARPGSGAALTLGLDL